MKSKWRPRSEEWLWQSNLRYNLPYISDNVIDQCTLRSKRLETETESTLCTPQIPQGLNGLHPSLRHSA